jgi:uncharacterized membrane protein
MSRRLLTILLGLSVALNLFFLGVTAARVWHDARWRSERQAHSRLDSPSGAAGRRDPRRHRDPLSWLSDAEREQLRPRRRALLGIRRDAETVLRSEPFDAPKFKSSLDALRAQTDQIQSSVHQVLLQRAETLGPAERRRLADVGWGTPGERRRGPAGRD